MPFFEEGIIKARASHLSVEDEERSRAGAPRIIRRLNQEGDPVGKQRVAQIMREQDWRAKVAKKFKATTNSNHQLPVAPNLLSSMSKRRDCYDNASMESWNHSFKVEAIHREKFVSRAEVKRQIFEYIEIYYNRK